MDESCEAAVESLAVFGVTPVDDSDPADLRYQRPSQRWICICGHPTSNHHQDGTREWVCFPGNSFCPCQTLLPIIEVQDVRHFRCQTAGFGNKHAFGAGLRSAARKNKWYKPLRDIVCFKCESNEGGQYPVAIDRAGIVVNRPTELNVLLCKVCLAERLGYEPM